MLNVRRYPPENPLDIRYPTSYRQELAAEAVKDLEAAGVIGSAARDAWYEDMSNCRMNHIKLNAAAALLASKCGWGAAQCSALVNQLDENAVPVILSEEECHA